MVASRKLLFSTAALVLLLLSSIVTAVEKQDSVVKLALLHLSIMGQRIVSHSSNDSTILLIDWNQSQQRVDHQRVATVEND